MNNLVLSDRTLNILKNFATINQSLMFKEGNTIATISQGKKIYAKAKLDNDIKKSFAIYELPRLFNSLSVVPDYKIEIDDNYLLISSNDEQQTIRYAFADPDAITMPPDGGIKLGKPDITFTLTNEMLKAAIKAAGVLGMPEIAIVGDGEDVFIETCNQAKPSADRYRRKIECEGPGAEKQFKMIFKVENLKVMPEDYIVNVTFKKVAQFIGKDIEYFVVVETTSSVK
jgi:hypothetical protein